ncbi:MAG: alpha/beta hydrolase fold domain-containing protein [Jatrophihabitantaceae bacterium]
MAHLPRRAVILASGPLYRLSLNTRRSVAMQRRLSEASVRLNPVPRGTQVTPVRLGGQPAERVQLGPAEPPRAVLYLHGGGYVLGSARMYRVLAAHLARSTGAVVFTLDYRLAPEHRYPAALQDAVAAFDELVERHGFDPSRIAIAGDSAGGGLAVAAARALTDSGRPPAALALLSPWTEPSDSDMPDRDFVVNRAWGTSSAAMYRGTAEPTDPGYAPMYANLAGLPPMLVQYGADEMLHDQIERFLARAREAGCAVHAVESPTLWHSGQVLAGLLRDATDAVHDVGVFLRPHLDAIDSPRR